MVSYTVYPVQQWQAAPCLRFFFQLQQSSSKAHCVPTVPESPFFRPSPLPCSVCIMVQSATTGQSPLVQPTCDAPAGALHPCLRRTAPLCLACLLLLSVAAVVCPCCPTACWPLRMLAGCGQWARCGWHRRQHLLSRPV
jgi:hypothetical protein